MKCPNCKTDLKRAEVAVAGAKSKALSYQCPNCDHFEFETLSSQKVISELRESPLKIRQKVIGLSQDRLGVYLNKSVVDSLKINKGDELLVSVPDKKHIVLELVG
jgi:hypothetical protein